jgi:hypothetical protein
MGTTARSAPVYTGESTRTNASMENYVKANDALACDLQCQTLKTEFAENVRFLPPSLPRCFVSTLNEHPLVSRIDTRNF